jgi:hypothetical protein
MNMSPHPEHVAEQDTACAPRMPLLARPEITSGRQLWLASATGRRRSSAFIDIARAVGRHRRTHDASAAAAGVSSATNWTRACHTLKLPRWLHVPQAAPARFHRPSLG